jgi:hypothetical protein
MLDVSGESIARPELEAMIQERSLQEAWTRARAMRMQG